ncbi:MAG TPA: hypothetical protein VL094_03455 [Sphingomonadaceae bacterium]|nr:hypothetical protein [Sphingomonadaceae bacterium]
MDYSHFAGTDLPTRKDGWSGALRVKFLDHLSTQGTVRGACASVGMSHEAAYRLRRRDPLFARGWAAALVLARETSTDVLACRALDGVEEEVWHGGEMVGTRRRYDTRLLLAHLARLDRLVEQAPGESDAARFDELLALIGGAEAPGELAGPEPAGHKPETGACPIPADRESFIAQVREAAWSECFDELMEQQDEEEDRPHDAAEADEEAHFACDDAADEADEEAAQAALKAAAHWDEWFARACASVDDAIAGTTENPAPSRRLRGAAGLLSTVSTVSTSGGEGLGHLSNFG